MNKNNISSNYESFLSQLENTLINGINVKSVNVKIIWMKQTENRWELKSRSANMAPKISALPAKDYDLYKKLIKDYNAFPKEARNLNEIARAMTVLKLPFRSRRVRHFLDDYRKSFKQEKNNSFHYIEQQIQYLSDEVLRDSRPTRILQKEVIVNYYKASQPKDVLTESFKKNYDQKCATCQKWRTTAHKLSKCSLCQKVYYCNTDCQKADWKKHKINCIR